MADDVARINVNKLTRHITLQVKFVGVNENKVRIKIGTMLIKLATRIIGCGLVIDK
jgi:hypothetical protein